MAKTKEKKLKKKALSPAEVAEPKVAKKKEKKSIATTNPAHSLKMAFLLWRASNASQRGIRHKLQGLGVTYVEYLILDALNQAEKLDPPVQIHQSGLARMVQLDRMVVSKAARLMEDRGLVGRKSAKENARAQHLSITPQGKAILIEAQPLVEEATLAFFQQLNDKKAERLTKTLANLSNDSSLESTPDLEDSE